MNQTPVGSSEQKRLAENLVDEARYEPLGDDLPADVFEGFCGPVLPVITHYKQDPAPGGDKNGLIDLAEFEKMMARLAREKGRRYSTEQVREMFQKADIDQSNAVDFNEVRCGPASLARSLARLGASTDSRASLAA